MIRILIVAGLLFGMGCAGQQLEVVDVRQVASASGTPEIAAVRDLGAAGIVPGKPLKMGGDGRSVIGELLLVRGSQFGKQPTVTIGGQPAEVVAHVASGLVVRIPWGIDPGLVALELENKHGMARARLPVSRLAVIAIGDRLVIGELAADARFERARDLPLPRSRRLGITTEGTLALIAGGTPPKLSLVDLTASPPRVDRTRDLPGREVVAITTSSHVPLSAIVTDTHVVYLDMSRPASPAFYLERELPEALIKAGPLDAALAPDGRWLAVLTRTANQVGFFDARKPADLPDPLIVDAVAGARLDVASGLRFGADRRSLWIASGDNPRSIAGGQQALLATLLRLPEGKTIEREVLDIGDGAPLSVTAARGKPTPPGTAIRPEPGRSAFYIAAMPNAVLKQKPPVVADQLGRVFRVEAGQPPEVVLSGRWLLGSLDVVGETEVLVAVGCRQRGGVLERVVVSRRAWGDHPIQVQPLRAPLPAPTHPLWLGEVRAQP